MRLSQFVYLAAIREHGSIAAAAQFLFVSQPSVSAAIKELETELGFEILVRTRRGVTFTPQGERVLEHARSILREVEQMRHLSGERDEGIWGNLSIGGSSYFFDNVLLNTIIALRTRCPRISIAIRENDTLKLFPMVRDGKINIGVVIHCHVDEDKYQEKLHTFELQSTSVLEDEMVFLVRKTHPLAERGSVPLQEILRYPLALKQSPLQELALELFRSYRSDLDVLFLDDYSSLWKVASISNQMILTPLAVYRHRSKTDGELVAVHIADFHYGYSLCCVHNSSPLTPAEQVVAEEIQRQCRVLRE